MLRIVRFFCGVGIEDLVWEIPDPFGLHPVRRIQFNNLDLLLCVRRVVEGIQWHRRRVHARRELDSLLEDFV